MNTLTTKQIKEIKEYATDMGKGYQIKLTQAEESNRADEFHKEYPEGIKSYFAEKFAEFNSEARRQRCLDKLGHTPETLDARAELFNTTFWRAYENYQKKYAKAEAVLKKYKDIFTEAEQVAKNVDVSDIIDGFPCGDGMIYLGESQWDSELGKALRVLKNKERNMWGYKLPIKTPRYGQCVSFDERINREVCKFLQDKSIDAQSYTYID